MTQEHLHLQVRDEIGYLIIDRVDKRNAMSLDMWESMPALIARMTGDVAVKVLVVRGVDDTAFASGADIEEILQFAASETAAWRLMDAVRSAEQALADCPKPVIAMIRECASAVVSNWLWHATFASRATMPVSPYHRPSSDSSIASRRPDA